MSSYLHQAATRRQTPQSESIPGSGQVENNAGGFAWEVTPLERLRRFLILGSEGGTYYVGQRELTRDNIDGVLRALDDHGVEAVREIVTISKDGRAPKNDPALYALSLACAHPSLDVRRAALAALPEVARTGTHLFQFISFVEQQRGWGRGLRRAVSKWYEGRDPDQLAYQLVKYRQREGWTHRDALRLAHPGATSEEHTKLYDWLCGRISGLGAGSGLETVSAFAEAQVAKSPEATTKLIRKFGSKLSREMIQPDHLKSPLVWEALIDAGMPMTALLRNLATMTRIGLLKPMGDTTLKVCEQLEDEGRLRKAKVHPLSILIALATYRSGCSFRGDNTWQPVAKIVDALDAVFYKAFLNVEPTMKRHLVALDVSHSMTSSIANTMLSCREASAALAMVTARTEPQHHIVAFTAGGGTGITPLAISPRQRLDDVVQTVSGLRFGGTDCALPMLYAIAQSLDVDVFEILTDNETWAGGVHPAQALQQYRQKSGIDAKLVVVGMTSTGFSIADPNDPGMLDVVGFDASIPQLISSFVESDR